MTSAAPTPVFVNRAAELASFDRLIAGLSTGLQLAAVIWDDETHFDPDAAMRVHRLSGGWPYYVHALAQRALQISGDGRITPDIVDAALQHEIIGRDGAIAFHCQYLLRTALEGSDTVEGNRREAILRAVAHDQPFPRARLARRLTRYYSRAEVYRTINRLIDTDFLVETDGMLSFADPVFAVWLNVEPDRRDPLTTLGQPEALRRLLSWFVAQHAAASSGDSNGQFAPFPRLRNVLAKDPGVSIPDRGINKRPTVSMTVGRLSLPRLGFRQSRQPGGSDGDGFLAFEPGPDLYPIDVPCADKPRPQHRPKISPDDWLQIRAEYATKSLRQLAAEWKVSPETIRKIVATEHR